MLQEIINKENIKDFYLEHDKESIVNEIQKNSIDGKGISISGIVEYLKKRFIIVNCENDDFFIYLNTGKYKSITKTKLQTMIYYLLKEIKINTNSEFERELGLILERETMILDKLNTQKDRIYLINGWYDLKNMKFIEGHSPENLTTIILPINYNFEAKCPKFMNFLREVMSGSKLDAEECSKRVLLMQEIMGYFIATTTQNLQKAFIFFSDGSSGKSTFSNIIQMLLGKENVSATPLSKFNTQFGLQSMHDKHLNVSSESEVSNFNTEQFKSLTGGDNIEVNIKYKAPETVRSIVKLLFLMNKLPATTDQSEGFWRRIILINFERQFVDIEKYEMLKNEGKTDMTKYGIKNINLEEELKTEIDGIFIFALEGLKRLINNGFTLSIPKSVKEAMESYRRTQNPVEEFFDTRMESDKAAEHKKADFYYKFQDWCEYNGRNIKGISKYKFWDEMKKKFRKNDISIEDIVVTRRGIEWIKGFRLKDFEGSDNIIETC